MEMEMEKHILLEQNFNLKENIGYKIDDFEILQTLGKGSYGYVSKVKSRKNQKIYAMKMIDFSLIKDEQEKQLSKTEMEIISKLDSPHIIKFYGNFTDGDRYYILMEFINNGDIKGYISAYQNMKKIIPENELWELFFQCISGLVYIHNRNIIHRDIKPANLFMTDNKSIKIGDFGVSAKRKQNTQNINSTKNFSKETLMIGTPLYMSPEMYNHKEYGSKVDVYAMGCTFYEMCFFSPPRIPIPIMNPQGEIITDLQDVTPKENLSVYSKELVNLIKWMIEKDEKKRPSSNEVFNMIRNSFIMKNAIRNSSIGCAFKCLFTYKNIMNDLKKNVNYNQIEIKQQKPISSIFLYAFDNHKNTDFKIKLNEIRLVLTFNDPLMEEKDEVEPEYLINFIIKQIHIENNPWKFYRIFTKEDDYDFFNEEKMFQKYKYTFLNIFKSNIADKFYGAKEITKTCLSCNKPRYYIESFYFLKFDAYEINKHFSKSNNFILEALKKERESYVQKELNCPFCKGNRMHKVKKNIFAISSNLIISLESEEKNFNTQYLNYPFILNLSEFNSGIHNLKGVIKKTIKDGIKYFICIYKEDNQWFLNDGINIEKVKCDSPLNHNSGNVIMLFYSQD